jgi:hypothetical protein
MVPSEELPRWEKFIHPLATALNFAFGCHHTKLSRVFTIRGRTYKVCCDCGADFDYSLQRMSIVPRHAARGWPKRLRIRHT